MAESSAEAGPLLPLKLLEVAAATTVLEFLIELRTDGSCIALSELPGVLAELLRTAWNSIQTGLSHSQHHFGDEHGVTLSEPAAHFYLWHSSPVLRRVSSPAELTDAADAVSQPLADAAMGPGFEGTTVELLPIVKAVNEEMTKVLRDTLPASVAASAASLHEINVVYTSTDSGAEFMAPFEVCWVADGAAKSFGVPHLRGFRDYHVAYLQKELRCKGLGRCVNYNLVDCFLVPAHEIIHIVQHEAGQTDGSKTGMQSEHDASVPPLLLILLAAARPGGMCSGFSPDRALAVPPWFPLFLIVFSLKRYTNYLARVAGYPPAVDEAYRQWTAAFGVPVVEATAPAAEEAAAAAGGAGAGAGASAEAAASSSAPAMLQVHDVLQAAAGEMARREAADLAARDPEAAAAAAFDVDAAELAVVSMMEDVFKMLVTMDRLSAFALAQAQADAGRKGESSDGGGVAVQAAAMAGLLDSITDAPALHRMCSALLAVMFEGRSGHVWSPENRARLQAALMEQGVPAIDVDANRRLWLHPWRGLGANGLPAPADSLE